MCSSKVGPNSQTQLHPHPQSWLYYMCIGECKALCGSPELLSTPLVYARYAIALSIFLVLFSSLCCAHTKGRQVEQSRLCAAVRTWDNAKIGREVDLRNGIADAGKSIM